MLASPYGTYETSNGFIAIAMVNLHQLASAIDCATLLKYQQGDAFQHRDEIKQLLANHFKRENTDYWLKKLHQQDIWAMAVLDWKELQEHPAYRYLQMEQEVVTGDGKKIITTRCPVRINGERLTNGKAAPQLGENTFSIIKEFQDNPMQTVIRPYIAETV